MEKFEVQICGTSQRGATYRARQIGKDVMLNISLAEFNNCKVQGADGGFTQGLKDGEFYTVAGTVDKSTLDDGGLIYMLRPLMAKLTTPTINWDELTEAQLEPNKREFTPIGSANTNTARPVAPRPTQVQVAAAMAAQAPLPDGAAAVPGPAVDDDDIPPF